MSAGARITIRVSLLLLVAADLALLGMRLRPLAEMFNLPGGASTGIDPAVCLLGYAGLVLWLTGERGSELVGAQSAVTTLGFAAGILLAAHFWIGGLPPLPETDAVQWVLLSGAGILWGLSGARALRAGSSVGASLIAGIWSSMVSSLMACAVVLGQFYVTGPPPETQDSYKRFQEIGLGDPVTVILVHALSAATALLLVGPLAGGGYALIFAWLGRKRAVPA
jgi:hypothetical protein